MTKSVEYLNKNMSSLESKIDYWLWRMFTILFILATVVGGIESGINGKVTAISYAAFTPIIVYGFLSYFVNEWMRKRKDEILREGGFDPLK